ncbi:uncharacterized protein EI97DRAFT_439113 [Westerdykella ornata]|uniref:Uncharacterized protein n=1 Tax=Westerdykella ornata TaxID=318751 RepID=A0A6A6JW38_WESOR|nr:uncharacterized protein EI97DRAFT_439113 [Westerdykella ornata]KAF2280028.1 hypothetical protein EI97DRAFT_439113 [Westerdykella ornata]
MIFLDIPSRSSLTDKLLLLLIQPLHSPHPRTLPAPALPPALSPPQNCHPQPNPPIPTCAQTAGPTPTPTAPVPPTSTGSTTKSNTTQHPSQTFSIPIPTGPVSLQNSNGSTQPNPTTNNNLPHPHPVPAINRIQDTPTKTKTLTRKGKERKTTLSQARPRADIPPPSPITHHPPHTHRRSVHARMFQFIAIHVTDPQPQHGIVNICDGTGVGTETLYERNEQPKTPSRGNGMVP